MGFLCQKIFRNRKCNFVVFCWRVADHKIEQTLLQNMAVIRVPAEAFRVFFLCIIWYTISSTNSVVGKKLLNEFPHPTTVAFAQVLCTALFLGPTLVLWRVPKAVEIPGPAFYKLIIPLAFGKALAAVSAYFSIWKVPVSYAHTGKILLKIWVA